MGQSESDSHGFLCTAVHVIISFSASFSLLSIYRRPQDRMGGQEIERERKEETMRPEKRELHELPWPALL